MRIAFVSCGLLDSLFPLLRRLSKFVEIDLYISVYGDKFNENVASFDLSQQPYGLINEKCSRKIMGEPLLNYLEGGNGNIQVKLFRYPNLKILNKKNLSLHRNFAIEINRNQYDLVHLNGYRGSLMFLYAFLKRTTAKAWTIHDPILHSGEDKWQTRFAYKTFRFLDAHFILHNESQRPEFIRRYNIKPDHCHYIRFGSFDIFKIFKNGHFTPQRNAVLFYGRISPYKGVEYLVKAAKIARKKVPSLKVVIAGKPNYAIDLSSIKADGTFEVIDRFIENEEMVQMIESSTFVVCPYTDATQSGVIMTAFAFHKPVLASAVGGIPEVVEDGVNGSLVPPKDENALAEAMVDLLTHKHKLESMCEVLRKREENGSHSWNGIARSLFEVYQKAIKKN